MTRGVEMLLTAALPYTLTQLAHAAPHPINDTDVPFRTPYSTMHRRHPLHAGYHAATLYIVTIP